MSKDESICATVRFALRHYNDATTTESDRDSILKAAIVSLPELESETAGRVLFHRTEAARHQMELVGMPAKPSA